MGNMNKNLAGIFLILVSLGTPVLLLGDEPSSAPATETFYSANRRYLAISDVSVEKTFVYKINTSGSKTLLWDIPGWFRYIYLSNDGDYLVTDNTGGLLWKKFGKRDVVLRIFRNGNEIQKYRVTDLIDHIWNLEKTVSHYRWGNIENLDGKIVNITTVEGRAQIDSVTGELKKSKDKSGTSRSEGFPLKTIRFFDLLPKVF